MNANVESESTGGAFDTVKWILVVVILAGAIVANNLYGEMSVLVRAGAFLVAVAVAMFLASTTDKGRTFMVFAKESKTEVRRVVWPSRQETVHTTLIIALVTVVMGFLLWGLDNGLRFVIGLFTGFGG